MSVRSLLPNLWGPVSDRRFAADPFAAMRQEMERYFDQPARLPAAWSGAAPKINVVEKDKTIVIDAELPGVDAKDVEILVDGDLLTIKGEKKAEKEDKAEQRHLYECSYGAFSRSLQLPFDIPADAVQAAFKNGVLSVTVPVPAVERAQARKIDIKAAA